MKIKFSKSPVMMLAKLALAGLLCLVIVFIVHSNYKSRQGSRIELKSRYTFSVRIDSDGNVLDEAYNEGEKSEYQEFETPQLSKMADIWLTQFTGQFTLILFLMFKFTSYHCIIKSSNQFHTFTRPC